MSNAPTRQHLVVVSVGTYHLPFDRLSAWVERWHADRRDVRLVMQHGPSRPVRTAENVGILPYAELLSLCRDADAVVLQGGAGGVMDMRALGVVPIVVPRVPLNDEVVDDHQLVFSAEMAQLGLIHRAIAYDQFAERLDDALRAGTGDGSPPVGTPGVAQLRTHLERPPAPVLLPRRLGRALTAAAAVVGARLTRTGR